MSSESCTLRVDCGRSLGVLLRLLREMDQAVLCESKIRARGIACRKPGEADYSYFATYEMLKRKLSPSPGLLPNGDAAPAPPLSIGAVMFAGGTAGVAMWALAIPPDVSRGEQSVSRLGVTDTRPVED